MPGGPANSVGALSRLFRRFSRSASEEHSEQLQRAGAEAGCDHIDACELRSAVTLLGQVTMVTLNPHGIQRGFEAELNDGTGTVRLVWMGRPQVPGIDPGRTMRVQGRLTLIDGHRAIFNPRYTLLPD